MICPNCNNVNSEGALFCGACGRKLETAGATQSEPVAAATQQKPVEVIEAQATIIQPVAQGATVMERAAHTTRANMREDFRAYDAYRRMIDEKQAAVQAAKEAAWLTQNEIDRMKKRFIICLVIGLIVGVSFGSNVMFNGSADISFLSRFTGMLFLALVVTWWPFGFTLIKDFIGKHGFFVVGSAAFFVTAAFLALIFAWFVGLPYAIYLLYKISKEKKNLENIKELVALREHELETAMAS